MAYNPKYTIEIKYDSSPADFKVVVTKNATAVADGTVITAVPGGSTADKNIHNKGMQGLVAAFDDLSLNGV